VLTRAVGLEPGVEAEVSNLELASGDRVLICSDGLSGMLSDEAICRLLTDHPVGSAADALVGAANEAGGVDNISVVLVEAG
jgi:protein phosphatase